MDTESGSGTRESGGKFYRTTLCLAYQSFGVVYGDLITSPIYVYKNTFSGSLRLYKEDHEILGVLSLVFWTLTLIPLFKYAIFVLRADNHGEGGTFALYSLLCRNSMMSLLNTHNAAHERISSYNSEISTHETRSSLLIKDFFEKYYTSRVVLFLVVLLGTSMVIGDGILAPTMSVLSAVHGIQIKVPDLHENYTVLAACIILLGLFALQHYGTHRVGFLFAPILLAWLLCISGVGIYNIFRWNPGVFRALSPYYIYNFFRKTGKAGWSSLGGIVLCITGTEAMFANLGHFTRLSVRVAFTGVVYPCLVFAYMGEAAYLSKHKADINSSFYKAIPEAIFWPVFIIATLATAVGSQAIISATFSIISQCRTLSCFPRVKIIHTSNQIHGQIYIPEVNWTLMVLCLAVVVGFKDTKLIGNAYGLAVIIMMFVTTCLMFLIITTIWKQNIFVAFMFVIVFGSVELLYLSACLAKVHKGGWFPLLVSLIVSSLMSIWHYGTWKKHEFELQNKVNLDNLLSLGPSLGMTRVPGIGLIYSNVTSGVPSMFAHFVTNFPAIHQILIFVNLQSLMIPKVPASERFLIGRIGLPEYCVFRCIVRYGYKEIRDSYDFETQLIVKVAEFLKCESNGEELKVLGQSTNIMSDPISMATEYSGGGGGSGWRRRVRFRNIGSSEEVKQLIEAGESGVVYMMGNTNLVASEASSLVKKFALNIVYGFLRRNCRQPATALGVPHASLIQVGITYHV
ncbi:K_trans domain-containing protein [Cephalotus follicularis]|uniref:Potassium transporter n=1 Tax=Cephalotus follicularis TaxID=3775 RepID=A0A1Q3B804_CEPFO|nr:K_trans domain-containing protein [Cephalotus follicularis]